MTLERRRLYARGVEGESVERIDAAAVQYGDDVFVGINHGEAYEKLTAIHPEIIAANADIKNGFLTSTGRFVSRDEASVIADKAEQIRDEMKNKIRTGLHSEDLKRE